MILLLLQLFNPCCQLFCCLKQFIKLIIIWSQFYFQFFKSWSIIKLTLNACVQIIKSSFDFTFIHKLVDTFLLLCTITFQEFNFLSFNTIVDFFSDILNTCFLGVATHHCFFNSFQFRYWSKSINSVLYMFKITFNFHKPNLSIVNLFESCL